MNKRPVAAGKLNMAIIDFLLIARVPACHKSR
jgi:hypothetical protein